MRFSPLLPHHLLQAQQRISGKVRQTPILSDHYINRACNANVHFKCENLQITGSFKVRGAFNTLLLLSADQLKHGVATHSSGNHGQALAFAAKTLGVQAYVVMPENSPKVKIQGVKEHGVVVTFCQPTLAARESKLKEVTAETGATFIHPYDNDRVIAGQSTVALEIFSELQRVDILIAPLGGGGLLSGTGLAARFFSPDTNVFGAEPETVNDGYRSFKSGKLETNDPNTTTIADGLRTHLSTRTLTYIRADTTDIFTVSEEEISEALNLIRQRLKIIVEPSAAVPLAVLIKNKVQFAGRTVGLILSGGNIDH